MGKDTKRNAKKAKWIKTYLEVFKIHHKKLLIFLFSASALVKLACLPPAAPHPRTSSPTPPPPDQQIPSPSSPRTSRPKMKNKHRLS